MVPLIVNSEKGFNQKQFTKELLKLCKEHKTKNKALAFAFIVYDFEDNTIQDILEKDKLWSALDKISGTSLSVFYINSQNSYYERRQQDIYKEQLRQRSTRAKNGVIEFLRPITLEDTPLDETTRFLKTEFDLDERVKHPFILFFQTNGEEISDHFVIVLKEKELEKAFLEIRTQIEFAVNSVSKVESEFYGNHNEIFNLIKDGVKGGNAWEFINKKLLSQISIGAIIALVKTIAH